MSSQPEAQHHEGKHPTFKQYVFIALILFVIKTNKIKAFRGITIYCVDIL